MKGLINSILTTIICLLSTTNLQAQQSIRQGTFTVAGSTYKISNSLLTPTYLIVNNDRSELKPNLLEANGISLELARTKMTNQAELKKVVCEALGNETKRKLTVAKEKIYGWIYYRVDGTVISVVFIVSESTVLTLDDLARIENTLKQRFKADLESVGNLHQHLYHVNFDYEWDFGK